MPKAFALTAVISLAVIFGVAVFKAGATKPEQPLPVSRIVFLPRLTGSIVEDETKLSRWFGTANGGGISVFLQSEPDGEYLVELRPSIDGTGEHGITRPILSGHVTSPFMANGGDGYPFYFGVVASQVSVSLAKHGTGTPTIESAWLYCSSLLPAVQAAR